LLPVFRQKNPILIKTGRKWPVGQTGICGQII
jgi:hypothetical protein